MESIGNKIQPILGEIEDTLWEFEMHTADQPNFPIDSLRSSSKIVMSVIMDKLWDLQEKENMSMEDRGHMAQKCGEDFRQFIKTYTNIDPHDFYK